MSTWKVIMYVDPETCTVEFDNRSYYPDDVITVPNIPLQWEVRYTPHFGLHLACFSVDESGATSFKYKVACRVCGDYCLGDGYGHRVILPEEEENPVRREFRKLPLPLRLLYEVGKDVENGTDNPGVPIRDLVFQKAMTIPKKMPVGRRFPGFYTDGDTEVDTSVGASASILTWKVKNWSWAIEYHLTNNSGGIVYFIRAVHVNQDVIDSQGLMDCAEKLRNLGEKGFKNKVQGVIIRHSSLTAN